MYSWPDYDDLPCYNKQEDELSDKECVERQREKISKWRANLIWCLDATFCKAIRRNIVYTIIILMKVDRRILWDLRHNFHPNFNPSSTRPALLEELRRKCNIYK